MRRLLSAETSGRGKRNLNREVERLKSLRETLKGMNGKERREYLWTYYKGRIILVGLVLVALIAVIVL